MSLAPSVSVGVCCAIWYFAMIPSAVLVAELSTTLCQVVTQLSTASPATSVEFAKTIFSGRSGATFGVAQLAPSMSIA